jgi:hypothetical protein
VPKPDHISDLERRQQALEEELTKALLQYSTEDLLIADLKRRRLILRDELDGRTPRRNGCHDVGLLIAA